jgi:flap endonuclease-1
MGVDLGDIVPKDKITLDDLAGKTFAVDAYNILYQFLSIIRGPTGEPLMDSQGRVTSHLSGLLYRTTNLAERGIRLVYVFDGKPPVLKEAETARRRVVKETATVKYQTAVSRGETKEARKYAQATVRLQDTLLEDAHTLLNLMGIPQVYAPSEGEAQAAYMASKGDVWAAVSQDYDSLLFGATRLVRNLAITGRRKIPLRDAYIQVEPELIDLHKVLSQLGLTRDQLIDLGILLGTDFNPDGFKGVGPKTALKMLKEHGNIDRVIEFNKNLQPLQHLTGIRKIFHTPEVTSDYRLEWREADTESVVRFLCGDRDFNEERVRTAIQRAKAAAPAQVPSKTQTLEAFFDS